jgi:hypothetical protein
MERDDHFFCLKYGGPLKGSLENNAYIYQNYNNNDHLLSA